MIHVRDALRAKRDREDERMKVYERFVSRISDKIYRTIRADPAITLITYQIPEMEWGVPLYPMAEAMTYLLQKFEKQGFEVKNVGRNTIAVSWSREAAAPTGPAGRDPWRPTSSYRPTGKFAYSRGALDAAGR